MGIISLIVGALNPLSAITGSLERAYANFENAKTAQQKTAAKVEIANLEAKRDVVIAASANDKWWSTRELIGKCVAIYVFKIVVWDTVLGWGSTKNPGEHVTFIVMTVIGFYFVSKATETITNSIASAIARRQGK